MPTQTLESRIESSLLYTKEDGTQDFVHDRYRDFFVVREINRQLESGVISVSEAYSYLTQTPAWGLYLRDKSLHERAFSFLVDMCSERISRQLADHIITDYSRQKKKGQFDKGYSLHDFLFMVKVLAIKGIDGEDKQKFIAELEELITYYKYEGNIYSPQITAGFSVYPYVRALNALCILDRKRAFRVIDSQLSGLKFPPEMNIVDFAEFVKNHLDDPKVESLIEDAILGYMSRFDAPYEDWSE